MLPVTVIVSWLRDMPFSKIGVSCSCLAVEPIFDDGRRTAKSSDKSLYLKVDPTGIPSIETLMQSL